MYSEASTMWDVVTVRRTKSYVILLLHSSLLKKNLFSIAIQKNPTVFIESNIHAREWITAATSTYLLNELLTSNKTEIRYLANNYDFVIVPVMNVDGYVYTHTVVSLFAEFLAQ